MGFIAKVNDDLLYESPNGRQGFVIFSGDGLVHFGRDITSPQVETTVGYTAAALREIAEMMERRS